MLFLTNRVPVFTYIGVVFDFDEAKNAMQPTVIVNYAVLPN